MPSRLVADDEDDDEEEELVVRGAVPMGSDQSMCANCSRAWGLWWGGGWVGGVG